MTLFEQVVFARLQIRQGPGCASPFGATGELAAFPARTPTSLGSVFRHPFSSPPRYADCVLRPFHSVRGGVKLGPLSGACHAETRLGEGSTKTKRSPCLVAWVYFETTRVTWPSLHSGKPDEPITGPGAAVQKYA